MARTASRRNLFLLSLASFGWAVSFGLGAPLASLWLAESGQTAWTIGLNSSLYYLGVALVSPLVPWVMRRGNRGCVVVGMLLDALTTAVFPYMGNVFACHLLRLLGGAGTALSLIPMETLVNHNAPVARRARDFALYAFCVAAGIGCGTVLGLALYPHGPRLAFLVGGLITLLAIPLGWLGCARVPEPDAQEYEEPQPLPWRGQALAFGTAWVQGFLEGGTLAFLSLYLLSLHHSEGMVSVLMGGLFVGVVAAQLPLAWLADRLGRVRVLLMCHTLLLLGLALVPWTRSLLPLGAELLLLGACCGALYPLGLAVLGERVATAALARANAWYLACNCAGSLTGPLLIGLVIDAFGPRAQFAAGVVAVLLVLGLARMMRPTRRSTRPRLRETLRPHEAAAKRPPMAA